jgi:membrane associated rhomboid family serine protease
MFRSILEDVKESFRSGSKINRLILVNVSVFVIGVFVKIVLQGLHGTSDNNDYINFVRTLSLPSDLGVFIYKPWTLISHMFFHEGLWHLVFNMLNLFWFGNIVEDLLGSKRIIPIYILGGLAGAIFFWAFNFYSPAEMAYGASAASMALLAVAGAKAPNYLIPLLFLGEVRLKYIVLVFLVLDLIGISQQSNTGGHFAHLGGALFGFLYVAILNKGTDIANPFMDFIDKITFWYDKITGKQSRRNESKSKKVHLEIAYTNPKNPTRKSISINPENESLTEKVDSILDKIKKSGIESLTTEEKEFLENVSGKSK